MRSAGWAASLKLMVPKRSSAASQTSTSAGISALLMGDLPCSRKYSRVASAGEVPAPTRVSTRSSAAL